MLLGGEKNYLTISLWQSVMLSENNLPVSTHQNWGKLEKECHVYEGEFVMGGRECRVGRDKGELLMALWPKKELC